MKKLIVLLTFGVILCHTQAFGCSCIGEQPIREAIKNSDAVVVGEIISKEAVRMVDSSFADLFEFTIFKYQMVLTSKYKGKFNKDTVEVYSGRGGGDCGFRFQTGQEYIVYGDFDSYFGQQENTTPFPTGQNIIWTNICRRTTLKNDTEIREIEKYRKKKQTKNLHPTEPQE